MQPSTPYSQPPWPKCIELQASGWHWQVSSGQVGISLHVSEHQNSAVRLNVKHAKMNSTRNTYAPRMRRFKSEEGGNRTRMCEEKQSGLKTRQKSRWRARTPRAPPLPLGLCNQVSFASLAQSAIEEAFQSLFGKSSSSAGLKRFQKQPSSIGKQQGGELG